MGIVRMATNAYTYTSRKIQSYRSAMTTMLAFARRARAAARDMCGESFANSTWPASVQMVETARMEYI